MELRDILTSMPNTKEGTWEWLHGKITWFTNIRQHFQTWCYSDLLSTVLALLLFWDIGSKNRICFINCIIARLYVSITTRICDPQLNLCEYYGQVFGPQLQPTTTTTNICMTKVWPPGSKCENIATKRYRILSKHCNQAYV